MLKLKTYYNLQFDMGKYRNLHKLYISKSIHSLNNKKKRGFDFLFLDKQIESRGRTLLVDTCLYNIILYYIDKILVYYYHR